MNQFSNLCVHLAHRIITHTNGEILLEWKCCDINLFVIVICNTQNITVYGEDWSVLNISGHSDTQRHHPPLSHDLHWSLQGWMHIGAHICFMGFMGTQAYSYCEAVALYWGWAERPIRFEDVTEMPVWYASPVCSHGIWASRSNVCLKHGICWVYGCNYCKVLQVRHNNIPQFSCSALTALGICKDSLGTLRMGNFML